MVIGIEFNRVKTPSGKTFYRVAPYLDNVDKLKVGAVALILVTAVVLGTMHYTLKADTTDTSHIKQWNTYVPAY